MRTGNRSKLPAIRCPFLALCLALPVNAQRLNNGPNCDPGTPGASTDNSSWSYLFSNGIAAVCKSSGCELVNSKRGLVTALLPKGAGNIATTYSEGASTFAGHNKWGHVVLTRSGNLRGRRSGGGCRDVFMFDFHQLDLDLDVQPGNEMLLTSTLLMLSGTSPPSNVETSTSSMSLDIMGNPLGKMCSFANIRASDWWSALGPRPAARVIAAWWCLGLYSEGSNSVQKRRKTRIL